MRMRIAIEIDVPEKMNNKFKYKIKCKETPMQRNKNYTYKTNKCLDLVNFVRAALWSLGYIIFTADILSVFSDNFSCFCFVYWLYWFCLLFSLFQNKKKLFVSADTKWSIFSVQDAKQLIENWMTHCLRLCDERFELKDICMTATNNHFTDIVPRSYSVLPFSLWMIWMIAKTYSVLIYRSQNRSQSRSLNGIVCIELKKGKEKQFKKITLKHFQYFWLKYYCISAETFG